jgi:hypothetical protein
MTNEQKINTGLVALWTLLAAIVFAGTFVLYKVYIVLLDLNEKYPSMGLAGWSLILLWVASCFFVWWYFERRFKRKGPTAPKTITNIHGQTITNPRGYEASLIYSIITLIILIQLINRLF